MATSATQRTIRELKKQGLVCEVTEKWLANVGPRGVRKDLFGFIDVVALDPSRGIVGVQSTSGTSAMADHLRKIAQECHENAQAWLDSRGIIEVWAWRKVKVKRGGKAVRWSPRIVEVTESVLREYA